MKKKKFALVVAVIATVMFFRAGYVCYHLPRYFPEFVVKHQMRDLLAACDMRGGLSFSVFGLDFYNIYPYDKRRAIVYRSHGGEILYYQFAEYMTDETLAILEACIGQTPVTIMNKVQGVPVFLYAYSDSEQGETAFMFPQKNKTTIRECISAASFKDMRNNGNISQTILLLRFDEKSHLKKVDRQWITLP